MKANNKGTFIVFWCCILIIILQVVNLFPQMQRISSPRVHSEGNFYVKNGTLYSDALVVKFKDYVIDLPRGVRHASKSNIRSNFPTVTEIINKFEQKFDSITLVKQIPDTQWGDIWRRHKITGELVQIEDLSQLFTIKFLKPVPFDSTLSEFLKLPEVEYAHEPVSVVYYETPNDPLFGSQWNLDVIDAIAAWDITHGSNTIKIGIVDEGTVQNHEDLQGKIVDGDGYEGEHGTWVAGVAGAKTNNSKGVASLGWNLSLNTYGEGALEFGNEGITAGNITEAANASHIINMSFGTFRYAIEEDIPTGCSDPTKWIAPNGVFWSVVPRSYSEIQTAVSNAIAQGVICIAAAGNASENHGNLPAECDPILLPFPSYPAQYPNVIAVSGTRMFDSVEEFRDGWNYGSFVAVAGPADHILTTDQSGGYFDPSGTSFSSPLVCALAGLIKSVNPGFSITNVRNIITSTADKINPSNCDGSPVYDANGWNPCLGYGRINAHAAVLEAAKKSLDSDATGHNSGRRLVRDGSGNYHLVFHSNGEIFYRKLVGGMNWQSANQLSSGNGNNKYPSIAFQGSNLYVVWQRYDGSSYDIFFRRSTNGGTSWDSATEIRSNASTTNPLPVIVSPKTDEIMVVYLYGQILESKRSTNNGSSWFTNVITEGILSSPSVAKVNRQAWGDGNPTTALVYGKSDTDVYYRYYDTGISGWSASTNLSSIVPGTATHQTPSLSPEGAGYTVVHVAWHETSGSGLYQNNIIYRKSTGYNSWNSQYTRIYYQDQRRPTITALHSSSVDIIFESNSATQIGKQHYNGSYWSGPTYIGSGQYPSVSIGSNQAKYVWTSSGSAPYTINISSETLSKEGESGEPYYERVISWLDTTNGRHHLTVRVKSLSLKTSQDEAQTLPLQPVSLDTVPDFTPANAFDYLVSTPALLPADAESLVVDLSLWTESAEKVGSGTNPKISLEFKNDNEQSLMKISGHSFSASGSISEEALRLAVPLTTVRQAVGSKSVKVNVQIEGLTPNSTTFASLGHIYDFNKSVEKSSNEQEALTSNSLPLTTSLIGSYPNPFNPETTIKYQVRYHGQVRLDIYNLRGQKIRTLVDDLRTPGEYETRWDGRDEYGQAIASGIYVI
jgi:thermitase